MIEISHLDVVFGNHTKRSLTLLDNGLSRDEIRQQTGDTIGVQDANLTIGKGEICVLMGLSGSGKSSLLRTLHGLNPIARGNLNIHLPSGTVDLANCSASKMRELRSKHVSMVFQKFALMPWLTVLDNVAFGLEMQGYSKAERTRMAMEKIDMVGLGGWHDKLPDELSGGMQQRVGLARAFAMDSDILLMDEPFSAPDPLIRSQLQDELLDLQRELNKTIVFVSHDLDEALKLGNHIAIMESAQIIQHGTPEDIVLNPKTTYVENFVANTNPLNVLAGQTLMTSVGAMEINEGRTYIGPNNHYWLDLSTDGQINAAGIHNQNLTVGNWQLGDPMPEHAQITKAPVEISMRDAINLRYSSGHPVLLMQDNSCVGILRDEDFYHALLGMHFKSADS